MVGTSRELAIRVRRIVAPALDQLEDTINTALVAMEDSGLEILSVQLDIPAPGARKSSAFVVFSGRADLASPGDDARRASETPRRPDAGLPLPPVRNANLSPRVPESGPRDTAARSET